MSTISSNGFNLSLDTLAPTGSITRPEATHGNAGYINTNKALTIFCGDATHYAVWFDANATGTLPESPTWKAVAQAATQNTEFTADGTYYYHLALRDDVGNVSSVFNTDVIYYDTQNPIVDNGVEGTGNIKVLINDGASYTRVRANSIKFGFRDIDKNAFQSGICCAQISGNIEGSPVEANLTAEEITAKQATRSFTFLSSAEDGTQTLTITVKDKAGNSATDTDSITLDTQGAVGHINIYNSDDTAKVPAYINYTSVYGRVDASNANDWAQYKVWCTGMDEPSTYTDVTAEQKTAGYASVPLTLSTGDGLKTVYAKVRDEAQKEAGTEGTQVTATVTLDQTAPTVSIALNKTHVSKVNSIDVAGETFDFTPFTCTNSVTEELSGVKEYELRVNGTKIAAYSDASGTANVPLTVPATFSMHQSDLGDQGTYELKLWVKDNAGNATESEGKTIYVDTTAPTGSAEASCGNGGWYGGDLVGTGFYKYSEATATASATDGPESAIAAGMWKMQCWVDTTANNTTMPGTVVTSTYAVNPTHAQIDWTGHAESASNYIHIKYIDAVGNAVFVHSAAFGIDTVVPGAGSISIPEVTNTPSITATISSTDATSGVAKMKIWGDLEETTESTATWVDYVESKALTLVGEDGTKTVNIRFRDTAGNVSEGTAASDTTELDTTSPTATLTLREPDDSAAKKSPSNDCQFKARISGTDDGTTGKAAYYTIYGNFNTGSQPEVGGGITRAAALADWKELTYGTGVEYLLTEMLYCEKNSTEGQTTKDVYLYVKDNAGNVYPHVEGQPTEPAASGLKQSFIYDTGAPSVVVSGVDYNRISKVHTVRNDNTEKYNDETKFVLTPDEVIQAWKCCAYVDEAAAKAGTYADDPIPTTAGSTNMSGSGISSSEAINAMVKGADYETALGGVTEAGEKDGLHYIVVYVQDLGGTWSKAATFTA